MNRDPRTLLQLCDTLDEEYAWRIKELSNFRNSIPKESNSIQRSLIRAGIPLLYAHWEGFVKEAANLYYKYVSYQKHNIGEFHSGFIAILLNKEANTLLDSKKISKQTYVFDKILEDLNSQAFFSGTSPIRTSNLKFDIFVDVCLLLNIDISKFELKEEFINVRLVERRNTIAHGKYLDIDYKDFNEIFQSIIKLLRNFKDEVTQSAALKNYLRKPNI